MAIKISNTTVIDDSARIVGAKSILPAVNSINAANGALNIDCSTGTSFIGNVPSNSGPITVSLINVPVILNTATRYSCVLSIFVTANTTINWSNNIFWPKGIKPILSEGRHLIVFTTADNGSIFNAVALTNFA